MICSQWTFFFFFLTFTSNPTGAAFNQNLLGQRHLVGAPIRFLFSKTLLLETSRCAAPIFPHLYACMCCFRIFSPHRKTSSESHCPGQMSYHFLTALLVGLRLCSDLQLWKPRQPDIISHINLLKQNEFDYCLPLRREAGLY